jgi:hypothetical protein
LGEGRISDDGSVLFGYAAGVGENCRSDVESEATLENVNTTSEGFFGPVRASGALGNPVAASSTGVGTVLSENVVDINGAGFGKSLNFIFAEQNATRKGQNINADAMAGFGTELEGAGKATIRGNLTNGTANAYAVARNSTATEEAMVIWPDINTGAILRPGAVPPFVGMDLAVANPLAMTPLVVEGDTVQQNTLVEPYFNYYWVYIESNSDAAFQPTQDLYLLPQLPPV